MDRDKLISILGLLGSDNAGERASAALKADRLVRNSGSSWDAIVAPPNYEQVLGLAFEMMQRNWPVTAACGIAMGLNVPVNGSQPNIANWSGGRWQQLLDWSSRSNHADYTAVKSQLDYLSANMRSVYSGLTAKINAARTVDEAAKLFRQYFGETKEVT